MPLLIDWLIGKYPTAKRETLKRMLQQGRVTVNGQPARRLKEPLKDGDVVKVSERVEKPKAGIEPLQIIHEDGDVLVVYKPAGLLTSTVAKEWRPTAIAIIRRYVADREPRARVGVIHRLDRDAGGLLVFSKNEEAYESLKQQFYEHSVDRIYLAVVAGKMKSKEGRIKSNLIERADGTVRPTSEPGKGQTAVSDYKVVKQAAGFSVLRVTLQTGRKHQIRAHLSHQGFPIVGDPMYGGPAHSAGLHLAAVALAFDHPRTGERMSFEAPAPAHIQSFLEEQS